MIKIQLFLISYIPLYGLVYLQLVADKYFQYQKNFKSNKILNNVLLIINENAVFGYYILALILFPLLFFIIYLGYRIKKIRDLINL